MSNLKESYIITDKNNQKQGKVFFTVKNEKYCAEILFNFLFPPSIQAITISGKEYKIKDLQKKCHLQADSYNELKKITEERVNEFSFLIKY